MIHLGLATVVIVAASLPWVLAVDLTPAEQRPYVGSSSFNTVTDLIVGWNGVQRLAGSDKDVGDPGPLRLLNPQLGGQNGGLAAGRSGLGGCKLAELAGAITSHCSTANNKPSCCGVRGSSR